MIEGLVEVWLSHPSHEGHLKCFNLWRKKSSDSPLSPIYSSVASTVALHLKQTYDVWGGDSKVDSDGGEREKRSGALGFMNPATDRLEGGRTMLKLLPQTQYQKQEVNAAAHYELSYHWIQPEQREWWEQVRKIKWNIKTVSDFISKLWTDVFWEILLFSYDHVSVCFLGLKSSHSYVNISTPGTRYAMGIVWGSREEAKVS